MRLSLLPFLGLISTVFIGCDQNRTTSSELTVRETSIVNTIPAPNDTAQNRASTPAASPVTVQGASIKDAENGKYQVLVTLTNTAKKNTKSIRLDYDLRDSLKSSDSKAQNLGTIMEVLQPGNTKSYSFNVALKDTAIKVIIGSVEFADKSGWTSDIKRTID